MYTHTHTHTHTYVQFYLCRICILVPMFQHSSPLLPLMHFFGNLVLSCTLCFVFCLAPNGGAPSEKGILQIPSSCPAPPFTITPHFDCPLQSIHTFSSPLKNLSHFSGVFLGWVLLQNQAHPHQALPISPLLAS